LFISLLFQAGRTMESEDAATKRARARGGGGRSAGDADRLSALPDSLLHAIMSFLKARQAVQTCVLATRWRHLWRSVPCLDVDCGGGAGGFFQRPCQAGFRGFHQ
jgi:hypothetical protein